MESALDCVPSVTWPQEAHLPLNTFPPAGWEGRWASGLTELGSKSHTLLVLRPASSSSCVWGQGSAEGQSCPYSPRVQSAQLGRPESRPPGNGWEASPGLGPTSPKARMWRGTQAGGGSHRSAPALSPKCCRPRQCLSAGGGVRRDSSCLGQDPVSGPGQPRRHPPLTFILYLDSCQWSCGPALPCVGDGKRVWN